MLLNNEPTHLSFVSLKSAWKMVPIVNIKFCLVFVLKCKQVQKNQLNWMRDGVISMEGSKTKHNVIKVKCLKFHK